MSQKPRTLKYAEALQAVEQRIVDALPEIIDGLIGRAKDGDTKAAVYLCDRILGRTTGAKVAPADDREAPYTEAAFELDEQEREEDNDYEAALRRIRGKTGSVVHMGLVYRNGRPYLYRSVRRGGRVTSEYLGRGIDALLIAALEADDRDCEAIRSGSKHGASGSNSTTWSEPSTNWPSEPETSPATP